MGWAFLNALETVGSYILAIGLVLIVINLFISRFRGPISGNDPFGGDTLEWSTTSPPPPYNYPVIPTVTSPYAMWDEEDREHDNRRLDRGEGLLDLSHETPASTVQDALEDEILSMPSHSVWPLVSALSLAGIFAMLVLGHFLIALGFLGAGGLTAIGWHHHGADA